MTKTPSRYRTYRSHPLYECPQEILDEAREVLRVAADWGDVATEADPLADAVVAALMPYIDEAHLLGIAWKDLTDEEVAALKRTASFMDDIGA